MKRWLPPVGVLLGLVISITGWWLYTGIHSDINAYSDCRAQGLYDDLIKGTGAMNGCEGTQQQLYLALGMLVLGLPVLLAGLYFLLSQHAGRITTRIPAQAVTVLLILALAGLGTGGYLGWQKYQDHRDTQRLQAAEKALAAMVLPAELAGPARRCYHDPTVRCSHSSLEPAQLTSVLASLLHGRVSSCATHKNGVPCTVFVPGTINGYRASAIAVPDLYFATDGPPPAGARRLTGFRTTKPVYINGSNVELHLLMPEE